MIQLSVHVVAGWMDNLGFYVLFNSISVISGRWISDSEMLYTMAPGLRSERFASQAGIELETARSEGYERSTQSRLKNCVCVCVCVVGRRVTRFFYLFEIFL